MVRKIILWIAAFLIAVGSMVYQRLSGPTYPVSGKTKLGGKDISYQLLRSHAGNTDCEIKILTEDSSVRGRILWKRYKTNDDITLTPMEYKDGFLSAKLPHQPPAGKLEYRVELKKDNEAILLPSEKHVVIRFRGDVPNYIIIPHVIFMIIAMFLSVRTGLEFFNTEPKLKLLTILTVIALIIGGLILGPIVQKFAFGEYWTGFPFGHDLTDNKTLIAFIAWLIALFAVYKFRDAKKWTLAAAIITLIVYLIPHSVLGSELDYSKLDDEKSKIENVQSK